MVGPTTEGAEDARGDESRARLALLAAGLGEFEWDIDEHSLWISDRLSAITGLAAGLSSTSEGPFPAGALHAEDVTAVGDLIGASISQSGPWEAQFRFLRRGGHSPIWLHCAARTYAGDLGGARRMIGIVRDISVDKGEADQLRALVAELDHRVKNVLASVQSLAAQSARRTTSLEAFLKTFVGRLQAMAAAHTLLTATRWRGVEISHIAAAELGGLAQGQARWSGPDIALNPRATHALTLALHELGANAVKFGALSTDAGRIELEWSLVDDDGFRLIWTEVNGPVVTPPTRRGFGSTLLERVTGRELGGTATLEYRPQGLRVVITGDRSARAESATVGPTPAPSPAASSPPGDSPSGASQGSLSQSDISGVRVLIVEDAVLLALELESGLADCGARVVGAAVDLDEAMEMLGLEFDVAVLDANLNGQSVTPVATALLARGTPFIFATGYGDAHAAPSGFDAPVVRKPYNVGQIASALREALGKAPRRQ